MSSVPALAKPFQAATSWDIATPQLGRERIRQTEGYELHQARPIPMRQITVFVPAEKPTLDFAFCERRRPRAFASDQIAHPWIIRRAGQPLGFHWMKWKYNACVLTSPYLRPMAALRRKERSKGTWANPERGRPRPQQRSNGRRLGRILTRPVYRTMLCPRTGTLRQPTVPERGRPRPQQRSYGRGLRPILTRPVYRTLLCPRTGTLRYWAGKHNRPYASRNRALLLGQSCGESTNFAFTGLFSIYRRVRASCSPSRIYVSQ
jgi:hypothetical protein